MTSDRFNKHLIISTLCFVALVFSCVLAALAWYGREVNPALDKIALLSLGYLTGLLGKTSSEPPAGTTNDPQAVIVENKQDDAVPVQTTDAPAPIEEPTDDAD